VDTRIDALGGVALEYSLLAPSGGPDLNDAICCRPYCGIDLAEVPRIAAALERWGDRFLERVYTPAERARYRTRVPSLAARFAAKEAVMKALGTGARGVGWKDIEILPDARGKPTVRLYGRGEARARSLGIQVWEISLSHSRETAVASVVALAPRGRHTGEQEER
jgi:holo-[acyl-carrier protein] synthase